MNLKVALSALLMLAGHCVQAQSGPSYEDTVSFIQERVNGSFVDFDSSTFSQFVRFDDCRMTGRREDSRMQVWEFQVDLRDLDENRIEFRSDGGFVFLVTVFYRELIKSKFSFVPAPGHSCRDYSGGPTKFAMVNGRCHGEPPLQANREIRALPPDHDNGPRVVRALRHLIQLCKSKDNHLF